MAHRIAPHRRVRIIELEIAVAADADQSYVADELSGLLSENGVGNPDGVIRDWSYTGHERLVQAGPDPKEGEVFRLPAVPGNPAEVLSQVEETGVIDEDTRALLESFRRRVYLALQDLTPGQVSDEAALVEEFLVGALWSAGHHDLAAMVEAGVTLVTDLPDDYQ
ncbi:MAG: hypothetical protein KKA73_29545 [Chloroflexi bacterium]|nr:hypothetical protein [Chloroflexota bacterium]MBU1751842.1 hypothetical protein [Chloroflexota bacterium]